MKKILCFDLDNVICKTTSNNYIKSLPIKKNIKLINYLYDNGYIIKIFTARYMGRNNENIQKAKKAGLLFTKKQLLDWNLKYHKLIMGKPSFDIYIDDKNLEYKKDWANSLKNKLKIRII